MNSLVSIVVPVFKVPEKYLRKCIDSLINQTMTKIEIILVDDGSPDNCGEICDEYAKIDNRIIVIHQENRGLSGARNAGVRAVSSAWFMFIDGDDWIEKNTCELLYKNISSNIDIVFCGVIKQYNSTQVNYKYDLYIPQKEYTSEAELRYIQKNLLNFNGNISQAWGKLVRTNCILENNIFHDEELKQGAEGIEYNIRLFSKIKGIKFIEKYLIHYTYNENSISAAHNENNHYMVLNCFQKIQKELDHNDQEIMYWFYNRMSYVILTTAISGYFSVSNPEPYILQKKKYKKFISAAIVKETLEKASLKNLSLSRRITMFFIKHNWFIPVKIIARIRNINKKHI